MKRFFTALLALALMFSAIVAMPVKAYAAENFEIGKKAAAIDEDGRFKVETRVKGEGKSKSHNEVIIMVDGSYSLEDDWNSVRSAIIRMGEKVFGNTGNNTLVTIMAFGTGANMVLEHAKSVEELNKALPESKWQMLYGRTNTNCEAGFAYISKYIKNHDSSLNKAYVIYVSDGEVNTDETKYVFANWSQHEWLQRDALSLAKWSVEEEEAKYQEGKVGLSHAYKTVYSDEWTNQHPEATEDDRTMAWANQVWADVYEHCGLSLDGEYSISTVERAFISYDEKYNTHVQEIFYYTTWGIDYSNGTGRAAEAGLALARNDKTAELYLVDVNDTSSWMSNMAGSASNVSFYDAGSVSNLLTTLENISTTLESSSHNEVFVTDYTSKWVKLDTTSVKVVDNNAGKTIWSSKDGWMISDNRPTAYTKPVVIDMVSAEDYENGGSDVVGNKNDVIYKLTWYVDDGINAGQYNYSLVYEVNVDTDENGFSYNTKYPSSGYTTFNCIKKDGDQVTNVKENIASPTVGVKYVEPETKPTEPKPTEPKPTKPKPTEPKPTETVPKPTEVEKIDVEGRKIWEDHDNKYGKRPKSINVKLFADGKHIATKKVTAKDDWKYSFRELTKYNGDDEEIKYTVSEEEVKNYKAKVDGYNIINTYVGPETKPDSTEPKTIDIEGRKIWEDQDDKRGKRPESITINLLADGKKVKSKEISAEDNWKYSFKKLPNFNDKGKKIEYTVTENKVANYKAKVDGYDIINTYKKSIFTSDDSSPRTGDYIMIAVAILIISGGLLVILLRKKKK